MIDELRETNRDAVEVIIGAGFPSVHPPRQERPPEPRKAALPSTDRELTLAFQREIDLDRYPFLRSHVIGGRPVLPFAIITEWLAHGALHENPGLQLHGLDNQRILKGVILDNGPQTVRVVTGKPRCIGSFFETDVELRSTAADGSELLHARACAILAPTLPGPPDFVKPRELTTCTYGRTIDAVYSDILFHGPHFHGIDGILGCCEKGIVAQLKAAPAPGQWMAEPLRTEWLTDPLVIDAGFQLGIVWCFEQMGSAALPSFEARYRQYKAAFPPDGATVVLQVRQVEPHKMTGDLTFLDAAGSVVACIEGCEWTADESLLEAFRQRQVTAANP
jgi:hypothetical protein